MRKMFKGREKCLKNTHTSINHLDPPQCFFSYCRLVLLTNFDGVAEFLFNSFIKYYWAKRDMKNYCH